MKKRDKRSDRNFSIAYILVMLLFVAIIALLLVVLGPAQPRQITAVQLGKATLSQSDLALELVAKNPAFSANEANNLAGKALYRSFITGEDARRILQSRIDSTQVNLTQINSTQANLTQINKSTPAAYASRRESVAVQSAGTLEALAVCPHKTSCQNNKLYQQQQKSDSGRCVPITEVAEYVRDCPKDMTCSSDGSRCVSSACPAKPFCYNGKLYQQNQLKDIRGRCVASTTEPREFVRECPAGCNKGMDGCKT